MTGIFNIINKYVLSYVLDFFMGICNNSFAMAILLFTVFVNLLLIPLSIKSQKSTLQQTRVKPKLDELRKKYGDDKQKYSAAMQQLYQDENVSMSGGCLPMIVRFIFILSIYYLVTQPLTYLARVPSETIETVRKYLDIGTTGYGPEIQILNAVKNIDLSSIVDPAVLNGVNGIREAASQINFNFFGIDLAQKPVFSWNFSEANALWVIPVLSFAAALLSGLISARIQKSVNPDAPSMLGMSLIMPFMSLIIAFNAPCGLGFYWACSSLIGGLIQAGMQYFYGPYRMLAKEREKAIIKLSDQEKKIKESAEN